MDHLSDSYNLLSKKYGRGLHFVIAGDTNDLKLDSILSLDSRLVQIVQEWTRLNPPAILDPIIMTLSSYYQEPKCLEPLDCDPEKMGRNLIIGLYCAGQSIQLTINPPDRLEK